MPTSEACFQGDTAAVLTEREGFYLSLSVHTLLEAGDLVSEFVDLVFEVLLTSSNTRIPGFHDRSEAIHRVEHGSAQKTCGDVEPAEYGLAGRSCGRGRREGSDGEAAGGPYGRPEHEFGGSLAQKQHPPFSRASTAKV